MADPRTFTLIGEFKDGITPELEKINKQLAALKANFAGVGSRKNTGFRGATKEIGKLVSAHKNLASSVKNVSNELRSATSVLQQYRKEMGKAAAATRAFQKSGGNMGSAAFAKNMRAANTEAQRYLKTLQQINSQKPRTMRAPGGGGGGGGRRGGGGGGRGGGPGGFHMAEFTFAFGLSQAVAQPITSAIVQGFQIGVDLMMKPFQYFAGAFGERVQDQISDLKAAGGFLSISKREKNPFVKDIDEAIQYQQETNQVFAKMAADLPGVTNEYVQVGKRLGDTAARIVGSDFKGAVAEANRIRATEEGRKFYGQQIVGTGAEARRETITTLLGELTKKTTLAGMGGRSGAGGISGAYGLPGLTERMLSQDEVSMGQFQRYAAVFSDPTISDALSRNIEEINKTQKNSVERFKALNKLLDEVVTKELIAKLRVSVDGIYQGLKSAIFDPDTGLFGLGRQFKGVAKKVNDLGQYVDEFGNVVSDVSKAVNDDLSVFELVSQIFAQVGQVITPIVENIKYVFDPLQKISSLLVQARHYTAEFARTFNNYAAGLENLSKEKGFDYLQKDGFLRLRASLGALNNLLLNVGAIGEGEFAANAKKLKADFGKDPGKVIGKIMKTMIDQLLNSKAAKDIGKMIGTIIGTVLTQVAQVTGFISGRLKSSSGLTDGLKEGFDAAGGPRAMGMIFRDVFTSMFNLLRKIMMALPMEAYIAGAIALVAPTLISTFVTKLVTMLLGSITAGIGGGAAAGGGAAGLAAIPIWGQIAALAAALVILEKPIMAFTKTIQNFGIKLQASSNWLTSATGQVIQGLGQLISGLTRFFNGLWEIVSGLLIGDKERVVAGIKKLFQGIADLFVGIGRTVGGLGGMVVGAIGNLFKTIVALLNDARIAAQKSMGLYKDNPNVPNPFTQPPPPKKPPAKPKAYGHSGTMSLGGALATEMRNKPVGSNLVIANSSEMVIPAAGGYGVQDLLETLRYGFSTLVSVYRQAQAQQSQTLRQINTTLISNQQQTNARFSKLETKFTTPGLGGLGGGSVGGGVDAFTGIAQRFGLQMTSGYRPGDPGYHGSNRARDFSNGTGPTPQMMQFAQFMASNYGSNLKELIYTPLGFSIKNGQKVPPYATSGHYNHVHVAYATGYGMPFTNAMEAMRFERGMTPGSVKIGSVTGNSAEGFGGGTVINGGINVTVNGGGVNDPDELASIIALKIGDAVAQTRAASVFV